MKPPFWTLSSYHFALHFLPAFTFIILLHLRLVLQLAFDLPDVHDVSSSL
jgi:hypothetical protein